MIAHRLSAATGRPYVASIWGGTDQRIFEAKPGLRSTFRTIARDAALLLPAAPWTGDYFADALQLERSRMRLLPVITLADAVFPPVLCETPRLLSVFAFDSWRRKGFALLVKAALLAAKECPGLTLDVYGRGGPKALIDMDSLVRDAGGRDCIIVKNAVDHERIQTVMNSYAGFVLPSRVETYGMVFVEAVLAGVPILWSQNEGVDGLVDPAEVGYRCNPHSAEDVAAGLVHLIHNQARLKQSIAALQRANAFEPLRRDAIGALYRDVLSVATTGQSQAASAA
jgi:glycosyltransferase involved in cell wall biosynthesis